MGSISYQDQPVKKPGVFLPPQFGNEIGMFEEENYFPLNDVTDAANLVAKNLFIWLSAVFTEAEYWVQTRKFKISLIN